MNGNVFGYKAEGTIPPHRIVRYGSETDFRAVGSAESIPAGISPEVGCSNAGDRIDVQEDGETLLELGETVSAGDFLTSGAYGIGVVASAGSKVIAQAKESGTANAIIRVNITKFVMP